MNWKTIAIIFITLFVIENVFIVWSTILILREEKQTMECYYEICKDYPEAWLEDGLCTCGDYDVLGNLQAVEWEVMK